MLRTNYRAVAAVVLLFFFASHAGAETFDGLVVRVIDGDSLVVAFDQGHIHVRLREIDAPERRQPFGEPSRLSLADICKNTARVSWTEKDRNGRLLGRVWCDGVYANAEQVRRGMAWVFDRYATERELYAPQDAARSAKIGLWADPTAIPPWQWRETRGVLEYRLTK